MNNNRTKLKSQLFYTGLFLYCVPTILQTTLLVETSYWNELFVYFLTHSKTFLTDIQYNLMIDGVLGIVLIADEHIAFKDGKWFHPYLTDIRRSLWCFLILAVAGISALVCGDRSFLACVIFIMASGSIDLDDIVKAVLTMLSVTVMLTGGLCAYGVIEDLMFKRQDIPIRHALGFNYPSTMMSDLFFIVVLYCWVMKMELSLLDMLLIEVLNLILFKLTDSRFGFLMIAVMTAGVYIFGLVRKKEIFAGRVRGFLVDGFGILMTLIMAGMCAISRTGLGQLLDRLLTKRIQYMTAGFRNYGVHLFGKNIQWVGFGGSDNTDSLLESYNFVDNSYARILMNYGILIFILVLVILIVMSRAVRIQYQDGRIILVLCVLMYCFVEPRLTDIYVNPFLFAAAPFIRGTFLEKRNGKR